MPAAGPLLTWQRTTTRSAKRNQAPYAPPRENPAQGPQGNRMSRFPRIWVPQVGRTRQTCAPSGVVRAQFAGVPATCSTLRR
jgi:hypothetical protein